MQRPRAHPQERSQNNQSIEDDHSYGHGPVGRAVNNTREPLARGDAHADKAQQHHYCENERYQDRDGYAYYGYGKQHDHGDHERPCQKTDESVEEVLKRAADELRADYAETYST